MISLIFLCAVFVLADSAYRSHLNTLARQEISYELSEKAHLLRESIQQRMGLIYSLAAFSKANRNERELSEQFAVFATSLEKSGQGIRFLGISPNGVNRYVYPIKGNEAVVNYNQLAEKRPETAAANWRAIETGRIILIGPYQLQQGGPGLVGRLAVFDDGYGFWGFVSIVLDMETILTNAGLTEQKQARTIYLLQRNNGLYVAGEKKIAEREPVQGIVNLFGDEWILYGVPAHGWVEYNATKLWPARLGFGVFLLVLFLLLYTLLTRNDWLTSELDKKIAELRKNQEQLYERSKIIEQSTNSIISTDLSGNIQTWNHGAERLFGWTAQEVLGKDISLLYPDDQQEFLQETVIRPLKENGSLELEVCMQRKDRSVLTAALSTWLLFDISGKAAGMVGYSIDITKHKRAEHSLQRDAQMATKVQNFLLSVPEPSDHLDIGTVHQPFGYVSGDLYFMDWRYGGNMLRGFLVDVTGHDLSTALHIASMHVLLREINERDLPLSDAMRWLNHRVAEYFAEGFFAGSLGFELDLQTRDLRWVCAGIPKIIVATKNQQGVVECPGMCLGISEEETFETHRIPLDVGDSFYFMTDGLYDQLGLQIKLPLKRYAEMVAMLHSLSKSEARRDDATAVCLHVRSLPQSLVRQDGWPQILRFDGYGDYQRLRGEVAKVLAEETGLAHSLQEVAVNEAIANALECRDGRSRNQKARVKFNKVGNWFIVRVKTSRIGFAGNAILRRLRANPEYMFSFGEDASMGRGIPMMLSMSHKMTYNSEGTEVLLAWRRGNSAEYIEGDNSWLKKTIKYALRSWRIYQSSKSCCSILTWSRWSWPRIWPISWSPSRLKLSV